MWAKDLIFLFTTGGALGPQAWIEAYMGVENAGETHIKHVTINCLASCSRGRVVKATD